MAQSITFGQQLRELRTSKNLSLRKLAELLGVHYVYVSQIERGIEKPSENFIRKIAEVFNLPNVDELLLSTGKIPSDIKKILVENAAEAPVLLREHVGGRFMDKRRQEILQMWKRNCSNGRIDYPIIDEIRAVKHKGYDVREAEALIQRCHELYEANETEKLLKYIAMIRRALRNAPRVDNPEFYSPTTFDAIRKSLSFSPKWQMDSDFRLDADTYYDRVYGGWLGKCIGGALGMPVEGWSHEKILSSYGEVVNYLSPPSTINDDTSYEIVFIHALKEHGISLTSEDLALEWLEHIPIGYTAEKVALDNLRKGLMPPLSATTDNPYSEWIGAQMRGEVCGFIAPGRPDIAIEYAYKDAIISHEREGVYGEMYDAALISLAFIEGDIRRLIEAGLAFVPPRSKFAKVVRDSIEWCRTSGDWREAWQKMAQSYLSEYNWVHTFPNIAAAVIGLWFGEGDFERTICITTMCGLDTDCNAGQVGAILGTIIGANQIPAKWREPIKDRLDSEVIGFEHLKISEIAKWTTEIGQTLVRVGKSE
ncbi:MAG TPA: helix-turn-helix domain-containing protein [Firmicutes bacterium]|nr:helix-turn-helix domain-containing protein [Bacillota bacterium]